MSNTSRTKDLDRGLKCPHYDHYSDAAIENVFSITAKYRQRNPGLFYFTHTRIKAYRTDDRVDGIEEYWEEDIYEEFDEDRGKNFVTLIEGNTGTGKSELCAYLTLRLEEEGRPVLYINKSDGLLTISSKRIPEFCNQYGIEPPETTSDSREFEETIEDIPNTVAHGLASDAISALSDNDIKDNVRELSNYIYDRLDLLLEQSEDEDENKSRKIITEEDYKNNSEIQIFNNEEKWPPTKAVDELNKRIINAIEGKYGVPPIDQLLREVGNKFEDTRPVFVMEDVSISGSEAEKLTDFMADQNPDYNWDFVLAGTTESTDEFKTQTSEARFNIYQTTKNLEESQVPYLEEENAVNFIRPYLGYIKAHDESVSYTRDQHNKIDTINSPEADSICDDCGYCDDDFRDLFPFNRNFVYRVFRHLEKPTPRGYIVRIHRILRRWIRGDIDSPADADVLQNAMFKTRPSEQVRNFSEHINRTALWYGDIDEDNERFVIDKRFTDAFGVLDDDWNLSEAPIEVNETEVFVPISDASEYIEQDEEIEDFESIKDEIKNRQAEIAPWRDNPRSPNLVTTDSDIQDGARVILEELTDDFKVEPRAPLKYSMGAEKKPLSFHKGANPRFDESLQDELEDYKIPVGTKELSESVFYRFVSLGVKNRFDTDPSNKPILQKFGTQLTSYAEEWQNYILESELDSAEKIYTQSGSDYDLEDFTLAAYSLVYLLDNPGRKLTAENIVRDFENDLSLDGHLEEYLKDEFGDDAYGQLQDLIDNSGKIKQLMKWKFGVIGSHLNREDIEEALNDNRPFDVLNTIGIAKISSKLSSSIQFTGKDSTTLRSIGIGLYRVNDALRSLEDRESKDSVSEIIHQSLGGADIERTQKIVSTIRSGYEIDRSLYEALGKLEDLEKDHIEDELQVSRLARSLDGGDKQDRIQKLLIEEQLTRGEVYEILEELNFDEIEDAEDLGSRFLQVGEIYVE